MQSVRSCEHARCVIPGLAGRRLLTAFLDQVTEDVTSEVHEALTTGKDKGCRFAIQVDGWKTKTSRTRHYGAVLVTWCDVTWQPRQACIGVYCLRGPRTGELYRDIMLEAMSRFGIEKRHLVAGLSDHEGAVRRGIRFLATNSVGCGCHALQLCVKHAVPSRGRRHGVASSSSSSNSSSSISEPSSFSPGAAGCDQNPSPVQSRRDPAHTAVQDAMKPIAKRTRSLVQFYIHNTKAHDNIEADAKHGGHPFRSFVLDTDTRWSSTQAMWATVVDNAAAHNATRGVRGGGALAYPPELSIDDVRELFQLVCVLEPECRAVVRSNAFRGALLPCRAFASCTLRVSMELGLVACSGVRSRSHIRSHCT